MNSDSRRGHAGRPWETSEGKEAEPPPANVYQVLTHHPLASDTVDHLHPRGTKNDNTTNREFVWKAARRVNALLGQPLQLLDLGCSGGGLVESVIETGGQAVGIEGSDYSRVRGRAAWANIPGNLFTANIAKPFLVMLDDRPARFNVVTAWEVLEHLSESDLEEFEVNVALHLAEGGYFMGSVNSASDRFEGIEYHQTIQEWHWWQRFFQQRGWVFDQVVWNLVNPDWVRGPYTDGAGSHPFVFRREGGSASPAGPLREQEQR